MKLRGTLATCALLAVSLATAPIAGAQEESWELPDTLFVESAREPIRYFSIYDRSITRSAWTQTLNYNQFGKRVSFGADASMTGAQGLRGLESDGLDGDIAGRLSWRALSSWIWSLDGRFGMVSKDDSRSTTDLRQNRIQIRTQYTANPLERVTATGVLFTEIQQDQSLAGRDVPGSRAFTDTTGATEIFTGHTTRDSAYTSTRRAGLSGSINWTPSPIVQARVLGSATRIRTTTETFTRDYWAPTPEDGATFDSTSQSRTETPNGDERIEAQLRVNLIPGVTTLASFKNVESDQQYYAITKGQLEQLSTSGRTASIHLEGSPVFGSQLIVDGVIGRGFRDYALQKNLTSLSHTATMTGNFSLFRPTTRFAFGFQLGRIRYDRQQSQNGTIVNRALNASGTRKITGRLWLDGTANISLYSRQYDNPISDRDDLRGYVNVGGGYRVSERCSTAVHFSWTRAHAVAIDPTASGLNNVQSIYQMDAFLNLKVTPTLSVVQNYQINANYLIYDYSERQNTLARIRRIETTAVDSLFSFGFIRLIHNFFFQDNGSYSRFADSEPRLYSVSQELYQQTLGLGLGLRPFRGMLLTATQSLANTRQYFPGPAADTIRNRWTLNLSAEVNRDLPGGMALSGTVQRLSEYTELAEDLPAIDTSEYWIAGITLLKDF